jgi:hypothetical protein
MKSIAHLCAAGLLVTGCAVGISKKFTISGGEVVCVPVYTEVPFSASGGWSYQDEDVVALASSVNQRNWETTRELTYGFAFSVKRHGEFPTSVKIEDVTDAEAKLLLLDNDPKLEEETQTDRGGYVPRSWSGKSAPQKATDINLQWLSSDQDSIRIHRYAITMNTGKKIVAYYALKFVRSTKREMRAALR